jgi:hypothetical protein
VAERSVSEARVRPLTGGFGWYRFDAISLDGRFVLVMAFHSGHLFSSRYYDEVLELRERGGVQPDGGEELADPTNHGAFAFALYDHGRTAAAAVAEAPLVRGGSDTWFPLLHSGELGLDPALPVPEAALGIGENRVVRDRDGSFTIGFSERSRWTSTHVEGSLGVRILTAGSPVLSLAAGEGPQREGAHDWQILALRTEVTGKIRWTDPFTRRHTLDFQGLGYIDRNVGRLPIAPSTGRWIWGRFQGSERTLVYYRLDPAGSVNGNGAAPRSFVYQGDRSGGALVEGAVIEPARIHRNRWGMPHPLEVRGSGGGKHWSAPVVRVVDRGPFYLRSLSRLSCDDQAMDGVPGITECFLPARWDVPLYRLVARSRIRRTA